MKALVFYEPFDIRVEEVPTPTINDDEALLRVKACAVCGTDVRIYRHGHFKIPKGERRILGHEVVGELVEVGSKVELFRPGARVSVAPNIGCGTCDACVSGHNQLCPQYEAFGISLDGGIAEYMKVTAKAIRQGNLLELDAEIDWKEAVLAEPLSCVLSGHEACQSKLGDNMVIIGTGPIGALHLLVARLSGVDLIVVSDTSDERLEEARSLGADVLVNPTRDDLHEVVMDVTKGRGADVVIIACSVPQVCTEALTLAATHGRILFFGGMPAGSENVLLNINLIHYRELKLFGTTGSNIRQFRKANRLLVKHKEEFTRLVKHTFSLTSAVEAVQWAASGKGLKTVVIP